MHPYGLNKNYQKHFLQSPSIEALSEDMHPLQQQEGYAISPYLFMQRDAYHLTTNIQYNKYNI